MLVATHLLGEWNGQAVRCLVIDKGHVEREVPAERLLRFVHARLAIPGAAGVVDPAPLVDPGQSATGASR